MKVANNPISKRFARYFMEHGAKGIRCGEEQIQYNDKFKQEAARIRLRIQKKYDLSDRERHTFTPEWFQHLIIPDKDNPSKPYRNPTMEGLYRACEALNWKIEELFVDPAVTISLEEMEPIRKKVIQTASTTTNIRLLSILSTMIDMMAEDPGQGPASKWKSGNGES